MIEMGINWSRAIDNPGDRDQDEQDLLARVRRRRDRVRCEHGEGGRNTETLMLLVLRRQRRPDNAPLEPTDHAGTSVSAIGAPTVGGIAILCSCFRMRQMPHGSHGLLHDSRGSSPAS